jgi:predicted site-specific integrase-resolvase
MRTGLPGSVSAGSSGCSLFGVTLEVLHPKKSGGRDELLEDFVSLATTFAGRLYGMRSAESRKRLPAESGQCNGVRDAA